ncbi:MAG: hypothetical protein JKY50_07910 [Oleispira sp.]|nr:hypothetical protein [Oleispira sp.]MBL4880207.1 hypothetical protein [Oleispira sp.]
MMDQQLKEHILGIIFFSTMSIAVSFIVFILPVFLITGWEGVQSHIGACIIASSIASLGWFHQLVQ